MIVEVIHCSIFGNLPIVWTNETGESGIEVTVHRNAVGLKQVGFPSLPPPRNLEGQSGFERNDRGTGFQMRGLETIYAPTQRSGS